MKKCPYCAEEIKEEAVKCKHCGSDIVSAGNGSTTVISNKFIVAAIGIITLVLIGYGIFYVKKSQIEKAVVDVVAKHYGYTADKYSFKLKDYTFKPPQKATLTVAAINENILWDIKCTKFDDKWTRSAEEYGNDGKDLDELQRILLRMASGMVVGGNVFYAREDGDRYRELLKKYNLKHPNAQMPGLGGLR